MIWRQKILYKLESDFFVFIFRLLNIILFLEAWMARPETKASISREKMQIELIDGYLGCPSRQLLGSGKFISIYLSILLKSYLISMCL